MSELSNAILKWVNCILPQHQINEPSQLYNGFLFYNILNLIDHFPQMNCKMFEMNNWAIILNNLKNIQNSIKLYFKQEIGKQFEEGFIDLIQIAKNRNLYEIIKFAELILVTTVQCSNKNFFIQKILTLSQETQQQLVSIVGKYIQHNQQIKAQTQSLQHSNVHKLLDKIEQLEIENQSLNQKVTESNKDKQESQKLFAEMQLKYINVMEEVGRLRNFVNLQNTNALHKQEQQLEKCKMMYNNLLEEKENLEMKHKEIQEKLILTEKKLENSEKKIKSIYCDKDQDQKRKSIQFLKDKEENKWKKLAEERQLQITQFLKFYQQNKQKYSILEQNNQKLVQEHKNIQIKYSVLKKQYEQLKIQMNNIMYKNIHIKSPQKLINTLDEDYIEMDDQVKIQKQNQEILIQQIEKLRIEKQQYAINLQNTVRQFYQYKKRTQSIQYIQKKMREIEILKNQKEQLRSCLQSLYNDKGEQIRILITVITQLRDQIWNHKNPNI